jgi:hypothetical protein
VKKLFAKHFKVEQLNFEVILRVDDEKIVLCSARAAIATKIMFWALARVIFSTVKSISWSNKLFFHGLPQRQETLTLLCDNLKNRITILGFYYVFPLIHIIPLFYNQTISLWTVE